jgi:hypothetical protein
MPFAVAYPARGQRPFHRQSRRVLSMGRKPSASSRTWSDSSLTNPGPRFQRKTNREEVATTVRIVLTYFIRAGVKVHRGSYFARRLFNKTFLPNVPKALPSSGTELGCLLVVFTVVFRGAGRISCVAMRRVSCWISSSARTLLLNENPLSRILGLNRLEAMFEQNGNV